MESSCKDNYNVSDAFTALVEMTNNDLKKGNKNNNATLKNKKQKETQSSCC